MYKLFCKAIGILKVVYALAVMGVFSWWYFITVVGLVVIVLL